MHQDCIRKAGYLERNSKPETKNRKHRNATGRQELQQEGRYSQGLFGSICSSLSRTAVHPQVGSRREHKGGEAVSKGPHDGVNGVVEGQQQCDEPHKEGCRETGICQLSL